MEKQNIYILGATGYIGRQLVKELAQNKQNRIIIFIHKTLSGKDFEPHICISGGLAAITPELLQQFPPKHIFHLARFAAASPLLRTFSASKGKKANEKLITLIQNLDNKPHIHYVSGSLMYGPSAAPHTENAKINPVGFAKPYYEAEKPFLLAREHNLFVSFYRPGWILGPSSWFKTFFWEPYQQKGFVPYYGSGAQEMSIVSLADCAAIIAHGANYLSNKQDLNVFGFPIINQKEFSQFLAEALGAPCKQIDITEMKRLGIDKQAIEALTNSIPLGTLHNKIYANYTYKNNDLKELIKRTINELKEN